MSMHTLLALRDEVEAIFEEKFGEPLVRRFPEVNHTGRASFYTNAELVAIWDFLSEAIQLEEMVE
tara:strand:+ start:99 stop:293 length:195 start_codon:yes stop_codon:yes gene_type:complete